MIPRILHRTIPETTTIQVEMWWARAIDLHPGWDFCTWQDPLDPDAWQTSPHWDRCTSGAQRAGLIRLEVLIAYGGIYLDSDVELYRPLDSLRPLRAFAAWEDHDVIPDAVLGATRNHPALVACMADALEHLEHGDGAWETGPGATTRQLANRDDVLLLPPGAFYPYHYTEKARRDERRAPWSFGAHHWHGSWLPTT